MKNHVIGREASPRLRDIFITDPISVYFTNRKTNSNDVKKHHDTVPAGYVRPGESSPTQGSTFPFISSRPCIFAHVYTMIVIYPVAAECCTSMLVERVRGQRVTFQKSKRVGGLYKICPCRYRFRRKTSPGSFSFGRTAIRSIEKAMSPGKVVSGTASPPPTSAGGAWHACPPTDRARQ